MQWIYSDTRISFPTLGIDINPHIGFTIGSFSVNFYGVILAAGLLLACIYGLRRKKEFGLTEDDVLDGALMIIPFAFICARLYYCIFSWDSYRDNPISILYVWEGGLAIYGGVIGAAIGIIIYCRAKKLPVATALDITAVSFLIGQAIGRWGNFINREAFGAETASFLRMGLANVHTGAVTYHHPTFLYESLWNAAGFVILHFLSKRRKYDGQVALGYAAWYGLGRTFIEGLRTDSLYLFGPIRVSQLLGAVSCFAAVTVLVIMSFREHKPEALYVNRVAAMEAQAAANADEESIEEEIVEGDTPNDTTETVEPAGETEE